jgi:hypothetical protein
MTSLEKKKVMTTVELFNNMLGYDLEVGIVGNTIYLIEDSKRFAVVEGSNTIDLLDALLAGISCGERNGEPKSCKSFSADEWETFQRGYQYGQSIRR